MGSFLVLDERQGNPLSQQEATPSKHRALSELDEELIELAIKAKHVDHGKSQLVLETMKLAFQAVRDGKDESQIFTDIRRAWEKDEESAEKP